jgi:hypothetical protein
VGERVLTLPGRRAKAVTLEQTVELVLENLNPLYAEVDLKDDYLYNSPKVSL